MDETDQLIEDAAVEITGKSSEEGLELRMTPKGQADGTYQTPFVWSASGDWTVTVNASLTNNQVIEREFDVTVEEKISLDVGPTGHNRSEDDHPERIPNEGAFIHILSPQDGAVFTAGEEVKLEVSTNNFVLGEAGGHWHVYVDRQPGQMIIGDITNAALRNLEPGEHRISTYLSVEGHEELEEGATVTITVLEAEAEDVSMK